MPWHDGRQPLDIEAGDQRRYGVAGPATGGLGSRRVAVSVRHRQHRFGAGDLAGSCGLAATQVKQLPTLLFQERAQRVLWAARHGDLLDYQLTRSHPINGDGQND
jgi:hypothetical protein